MNNKGFTMIELLIVLAISALILIMAIPSINGVTNDTRDKEYQEYKDSIIYGAKLYYRQRSVDLTWSGATTKTALVNYSDLLNANYVKEFTSAQKGSKKKCDVTSVTVKITKTGSKVSYEVNGLMCGIGTLKEIK